VSFQVGDDPRNPRTKQALNVVLLDNSSSVSEKDDSNGHTQS
jgi:hypothetical protein